MSPSFLFFDAFVAGLGRDFNHRSTIGIYGIFKVIMTKRNMLNLSLTVITKDVNIFFEEVNLPSFATRHFVQNF